MGLMPKVEGLFHDILRFGGPFLALCLDFGI